jgi:hypothetical protein
MNKLVRSMHVLACRFTSTSDVLKLENVFVLENVCCHTLRRVLTASTVQISLRLFQTHQQALQKIVIGAQLLATQPGPVVPL